MLHQCLDEGSKKVSLFCCINPEGIKAHQFSSMAALCLLKFIYDIDQRSDWIAAPDNKQLTIGNFSSIGYTFSPSSCIASRICQCHKEGGMLAGLLYLMTIPFDTISLQMSVSTSIKIRPDTFTT